MYRNSSHNCLPQGAVRYPVRLIREDLQLVSVPLKNVWFHQHRLRSGFATLFGVAKNESGTPSGILLDYWSNFPVKTFLEDILVAGRSKGFDHGV